MANKKCLVCKIPIEFGRLCWKCLADKSKVIDAELKVWYDTPNSPERNRKISLLIKQKENLNGDLGEIISP